MNLILKYLNKILFISLFIILIFPYITYGIDDKTLCFENISVKQGLSNNTVICVCQDHEGYMWFGTENGLNRYDGYSFKTYENDSSINSLSCNYIQDILEDYDGNIWTATWGGGLNKLDKKKDKFTCYIHNEKNINSIRSNIIYDIYLDDGGIMWLGTEDGLDSYNIKADKFTHYNIGELANISVKSIVSDKNNYLWVGTDKGLFRLNEKNMSIKHFVNLNNSLSEDKTVTFVYIDNKRNLWVASSGDLYKYKNNDKFIKFNIEKENKNYNEKPKIVSIYDDNKDYLWIVTESDGLKRFNKLSGNIEQFNYNPYNSDSLSSNSLTTIYKDKSDILWIGTYKSGVNKLRHTMFKYYKNDPLDKYSLNNNVVHAFYEDSKGIIWVGTESGGLNKFDRKTGRFYSYESNTIKNGLKNNMVWSICQDKQGELWVGNWNGGLTRFDRNMKPIGHYLGDNNVVSIVEDKYGVLWIGTYNGIYRYDRVKNEFINYRKGGKSNLSHNIVNVVYQDSKGDIWAGTEEGLSKLNRKTNTFINYLNNPVKDKKLKMNGIACLKEDKSGILWIGTWDDGLIKFDKSTGDYKVFNEDDGLKGNVVCGIAEDGLGNLWLSTNRGVYKFSIKNKKFKAYNEGNGLQGSEFNEGAVLTARSGEIFFGGINGFNSFLPKNIIDNKSNPEIVITNLAVMGKDYNINNEIKLSYKDKYFEFSFSSLDYTCPENNLFKYKLEGFDKSWIDSGEKRYAKYTNLRGGNYIFRVKGTNSDGKWSDKEGIINLSISKPLWETHFAYTFYALVILLAVFYYSKYKAKAKAKEIESNLQGLTTTLTSTIDINEVFKRLLKSFKSIINYDSAIGIIKKGNMFEIISVDGYTDEYIGKIYYNRIIDDILKEQKHVLIDEIDENSIENLNVNNIKSQLGVPIIYQNKICGMVIIEGKKSKQFKKGKIGLLLNFVAQAGIAIENARLFDELTSKNKSIKVLMDNAGQGFLSFGENLIIDDGYSRECTNIFNYEIKDKKFSNVIFKNDKEQVDFVDSILEDIFKVNDNYKLTMYLSLLPQEISINSKKIFIEYKFLKDNNNKKVIAILTDVTEKRVLEEKMEEEKNVLKMVVRIITNYNDFMLLIRDYKTFCSKGIMTFISSNNDVDELISFMAIKIHTFKGNFSQLDMFNSVKNLHDFESKLVNLRKCKDRITIDGVINFININDLSGFVSKDLNLYKNILGNRLINNENSIIVDKKIIDDIEKKAISMLSSIEKKSLLPEIRRMKYKKFSDLMARYPDYISLLADRFDKLIKPVRIQGGNFLVDEEKYNEFVKSLVHIFRNAADHGIEKLDMREKLNKEEFAAISCEISLSTHNIIIEIADDGRGIDVEKVKSAALGKGIINKEEADSLKGEVVNLIFNQGLSTKEAVSDISGRGIGLAAVKYEVEKLNGTIEVFTKKGIGTRFKITIPYVDNDIEEVSSEIIISPLIDTTYMFYKEQLGIEVVRKGNITTYQSDNCLIEHATVFIHIKGVLNGYFVLNVEDNLLKEMTRKFLIESNDIDEQEKYMLDALSECANVIIGNSLYDVPQIQDYVLVGTPIAILSENAALKMPKSNIITCDMDTPYGKLNIKFIDAKDNIIPEL